MNNFEYRITEDVYNWIKTGTKRIEVRLYNEKASRINIGDTITFRVLSNNNKSLKVKVTGLLRYANIFDLYDDFDKYLFSAKSMSKEELKSSLEEIFGKDEVDNHDILGIKFELID